MTGRYLIPLWKTHSGISTHTYFRSSISAHTCPFRQLTLTLSPTSGDSFFCVSHFIIFYFYLYKNMIPFFLSVSFPRTRREVPSLRGERGMLAYRGQNMQILQSLPRFLPLPLVGYGVSLTFAASLCSSKSGSLAITLPRTFFILVFPTAFYLRLRMTGRFLILFCKKLFLPFCSHLPLSSANADTFPDKRGQLTVCILSFYGNNQVIYFKNNNFFLP